jgi:hypothetical protein
MPESPSDNRLLPEEFYINLKSDDERKYDKHFNYKGRHIGQLKLFLCDLYTIVDYFHEDNTRQQGNCVVVYAGAAPGQHIGTLASMFPDIHWYLYDPETIPDVHTGEFNAELKLMALAKQNRRIYIRKRKFDKEEAQNFKQEIQGKDVIFLSDIWTSHRQKDNPDLHDDMLVQQECLYSLKPETACLKFRIPYTKNEKATISYVRGVLFNPPFNKKDSSAVRLLFRKEKGSEITKQDYNCCKIERLVAYHNQMNRTNETQNYGLKFCKALNNQYLEICPGYDKYDLLKLFEKCTTEKHFEWKHTNLSLLDKRKTGSIVVDSMTRRRLPITPSLSVSMQAQSNPYLLIL